MAHPRAGFRVPVAGLFRAAGDREGQQPAEKIVR